LAVASTTQITATPEELNYSDGVTSNIQTQLDANTTLANTKSSKAFAIAQAVALG
jgi:TolB-like protein